MREKKLEEWMKQYQKLIWSICYQMVHDEQAAEDLAQETFLSAWLHKEDCTEGFEKSWLARIAVNKAKDHLKSAYHRKVCPVEKELLTRETVCSAEDAFLEREGESTIAAVICAVPPPYAEVCELFYLKGYTPNEISMILDRKIKTVRTQLYRSKKQLSETILQQSMIQCS
ncbi:MAG: RNA polymerase sigma factor [Oscillospiraceae bacterium]|nr:RNA polymerase sigma factor [Oscillospiraceae bacterium]